MEATEVVTKGLSARQDSDLLELREREFRVPHVRPLWRVVKKVKTDGNCFGILGMVFKFVLNMFGNGLMEVDQRRTKLDGGLSQTPA